MTVIMFVLDVFVAVASLDAVQGTCCVPNKYEMKAGGEIAFGSAEAKPENVYMPRISVDFDKKMMSVASQTLGKYASNSTMIIDYKTQTGYIIDEKLESCIQMIIPGPMIGPCLPKDAKLLGDLTIGYGKNAIPAQSWYFRKSTKIPTSVQEVSMVLQKDGCIPITETINQKTVGFIMKESLLFFDYSPKVKNPSVFDIPSYCSKQVPNKMDPSTLPNHVGTIVRKFSE